MHVPGVEGLYAPLVEEVGALSHALEDLLYGLAVRHVRAVDGVRPLQGPLVPAE